MTTPATPDLATLRAMYPVASGGLTADEMARADKLANHYYDGCITKGQEPIDGALTLYIRRNEALDTPVKRAAFALLLTMIEGGE